MLPKHYGRYRIISQLGQGGMATVFLAEDPVLARMVALKVLQPHLTSDTGLMARFSSEARAIASLRSANIVEIFDFGLQDGQQFIVMEYMDSPSLQFICASLNGQPMLQAAAAAVICQAANGLAAAEKQGIVHRDIKPDNLMFNSAGFLKIADFGIAHLAGEQSRTAAGAVLGSPSFMAPEQIEGLKPTIQTDMWALGSVLFYLLSGKLPFNGPSITATMRNICDKAPVPAPESLHHADPALIGFMRTLLNKDPLQRGAGPRWLAAELRAWLAEQHVTDLQDTTRKYLETVPRPQQGTLAEITPAHAGNAGSISPSSFRSRKRSLFWIGTALAAAVVILTGFFLVKLPGRTEEKSVPKKIQSVVLNEAETILQPGEIKRMSPSITPPDADPSLSWLSSAPEVASVNSGIVKGLKPGSAFIRVASAADPAISTLMRVIVKEINPDHAASPPAEIPRKPAAARPRPKKTPPRPAPPPETRPEAKTASDKQVSGKAMLKITSSPPFASIKVDRKNWGETPMRHFRELEAGTHRIEIVHKLFPPLDTTVSLKADENRQFKFRLQ